MYLLTLNKDPILSYPILPYNEEEMADIRETLKRRNREQVMHGPAESVSVSNVEK